MKFSDILLRSYCEVPEKAAIKYLNRQKSYRELYTDTCRLANSMAMHGVCRGDCVCIACRNSIEFIEAQFAISFLGAIPVLINWRLSPSVIQNLVEQTNSKIVLLSNTDTVLHYKLNSMSKPPILVSTAHDALLPSNYEAFQEGAPDICVPAEVDDEDDALIMFTSGTSGNPKGVVLSNRAISSQIVRLDSTGLWHRDDVFLCLSPLCHAISLSVSALLYAGGELLLVPPEYVRDCGKVLDLIDKEKVTCTAMVPTVINRFVSYMEDNSLRNNSIKIIHYGASPMNWDLLKRCEKVFSCSFNQGYGMTETYGTVVNLLPADHKDTRHLSSVGRPSLGNEVRIVNSNGGILPSGSIGEVLVKTPSVMSRYLDKPELTAEVLQNGWYHTGDMGYLDKEGYLYLTGRKNDMIITGGENVYPQEIENCIRELDGVDAVCVCGLLDPIWGEVIAAAIVKKPGVALTEKDIAEHCAEALGRFKKPKQIMFLENLPVNEMGKVLRNKVQSMFLND